MTNNPNDTNRCEQLRKLKANILNEIASLQMNRTQEEDEGVGNPVEIVNVIKTLQETLATIDLELQKCPPIA
ncbi:MAG TPA: hypothetical protein VNG51_13535 [Ktedonobacteraceae bacterium]|nr:hypothetical protein [Ktedonobacteraceae bacterium]